MLVAACKAPDGSYWAVQRWQRRLPLLGFDPWLPRQSAFELHVSHWSGPLPVLEAYPNWTYKGAWQGVFGRYTYLGSPVYGFGATAKGIPKDGYGRNLYIDTLNSAYGPGWKRESGILTHKGTGTFCHSFVPQRPFAGAAVRQLPDRLPDRATPGLVDGKALAEHGRHVTARAVTLPELLAPTVGRGERASRIVVDELHGNVLEAPEHGHAWAVGRTPHPAAQPDMPDVAGAAPVLGDHFAPAFLPTLRRMTSAR